MKYSKLFGKTVREAKTDMQAASHRLLYQGGFVRESVPGRFYFLPLGMRVRDKIVKIIEKEMDDSGAQRMITPVLHPIELWKETNRTNSVGFELMTIKDRRGAGFALGGTAEEMFVDLVRNFRLSYKDLPLNLYQFGQKFRDEMRTKGGMLRAREFLMKDAYSFDVDEAEFNKEYEKMSEVYTSIFNQVGLDAKRVEAGNGYIGGDYSHEYIVEVEAGESRYFVTEDETYIKQEDVADFLKDMGNIDEDELPLQKVDAVRGTKMDDGVKFHKLPLWKQIKDVLYKDENGRFVLAIIRGDLDVNEAKLIKVSGSSSLTMAEDGEVRTLLNSERGFISPVSFKDRANEGVDILIVADDSLSTIKNMYGGANELNTDYLNINMGRDYKADLLGDIAMAVGGFKTKDGKLIHARKGVEVGNIFQLGYHYTNKMKGATFIDKDGKEKPYYMGCYGIGIGRTMATIVEIHHDDKGIIWPESVAPYKYHLITLNSKSDQSKIDKQANEIYEKLGSDDVLWDDREGVSPGQKFADADLIGCPVRIVLSDRSLSSGGVELKMRNEAESSVISIEALLK